MDPQSQFCHNPVCPDRGRAGEGTSGSIAYYFFLETAPGNSYATMEEDGWYLSTDAAEKLDAVHRPLLAPPLNAEDVKILRDHNLKFD